MSVKLLKDLNFTEIINGTQAVTEAGKDMLNNYRGYVYSNPVSCTVVNNFVREASNFGFDTGLSAILESVTKFINENNISWKLASACESISNNTSSYGYLAKVGIEQVQKLLEMKEKLKLNFAQSQVGKTLDFLFEENKDGFAVAKKLRILQRMAAALGCKLDAPFMTMAFMSLLLIPSIKISPSLSNTFV